MFKSLEGRLNLLFTAFVLLVVVSVGAMMWGNETQRQDALLINLAGRQRMLVQQMVRLAFETGEGEDAANAALQETEQTFDQTLRALMDGGEVPYSSKTTVIFPLTPDTEIRSALHQVNLIWNDFRALLDELQRTPREDPSFSITLQSIEEKSFMLVERADEVVRSYEADAIAKVNRLRAMQMGFLVGALILLGVGAWITRTSALKPLRELSRAASRLGENDLDSAVQVEGPQEMQALGAAFENMRVKLSSSRAELVELADSLERRVTQRTAELNALNEVSREISSRLDVQQVLNSVTEKARALLGGEAAALCLVDENQHWLKLQTLSGPKHAVAGNAMRVDNEFTNAVLTGNNTMICGVGSCRGGCRILSEEYRTSHLAAPLRIGDRVIGALCVGSPAHNQFAAESADMLTKLASVAAIALENARLFAQAERVATLDERRRVAAEMHDGLGQTLSYLGLMTDQVVEFLSDGQEGAALERLRKTRETIGKATSDVRHAINTLMDDSRANKDLCTRLRDTLDEVASQDDFESVWRSDIDFMPDCSPQIAEQVYNIAREALVNAARHANAKQISVQMGRNDGNYFVMIEDDGKGFDTSQPAPGGHFGLQIMQARTKQIGGRFELQSEFGRGTRVTLVWSDEAEDK